VFASGVSSTSHFGKSASFLFALFNREKHHPDKNPHPPDSPEAEAVTRRFQEV